MSKIFLIGDIHLSIGYPNKTEKWLKVHREYFNDFLIPMLTEKVEEGDMILQLGDFFDNRNVIPINILNYAMDIIVRISEIAPFHLIIGNHDCWSRSSDEINTIRPFKYIPNVNVYDKVTQINFEGKELLMMPFIENRLEQIKQIDDNNDCDYLFCHSDLQGARMHLTSIANKNYDKIGIDEFKGFDGVYSGHIHLLQKNKNFTFVGSAFQMDRNDYNEKKGIFILDVETGKTEFIENKISPVFKKVRIVEEDDIETLEELKDTKDYIDIFISNNLLVSNRKLRRKLEILLENGNFASIEYIDDITNDLEEINESEVIDVYDEDIDISIQLDYEDYVKEYILKQKYDNSKFKDGVIDEYNNIIKIYKDNYDA